MANGATYVAPHAKHFEAPEIFTQELETSHLHKLSGRNSILCVEIVQIRSATIRRRKV